MKTLKDYENLIRSTVKEIDAKDPNWKWSVHSFAKDRVRIRWGYLDYCGEKNNCFELTISDDYDDNDYPGERWLNIKLPDGTRITGEFVNDADKKHSWQVSWESGIKSLLSEMAYYAHSRY